MQPNGGWWAIAGSSLDSPKRPGRGTATKLGSRGVQEAHAKDSGTRESLHACVGGTLAG